MLPCHLKSKVFRGEIVGPNGFVRPDIFFFDDFAFGIEFCPTLGLKVTVLCYVFSPISHVTHNFELHSRHSINHKLQAFIVPS